MALLAALAPVACGSDEGPGGADPPPAPTEAATPAAEDGERAGEGTSRTRQADQERGERRSASEGAPAAEGDRPCVFVAPEGRLAEPEIPIDRGATGCRQARALARAAALGQPAGANLTLARDGFRCVPSTKTKGENVTYRCTSGSEVVEFGVQWSGEGG